MAPKLILIRHGEAEHNATALTETGLRQCGELQDHLRQHCPLTEIQHIVTSPMRRTLQTTLTGLDWLIKNGVPVEIDAQFQENSDAPCDTGSDLKVIAAEFPALDFSKVDPTYPDKSSDTLYAFRQSANIARGQSCLKRLYSRPEDVIAVVSHSGFLRTAISKRRFDYADYRIFTFRQDKANNQLRLVEDTWTAQKGGGMGRSPKGVQKIQIWDFPPSSDEDSEA